VFVWLFVCLSSHWAFHAHGWKLIDYRRRSGEPEYCKAHRVSQNIVRLIVLYRVGILHFVLIMQNNTAETSNYWTRYTDSFLASPGVSYKFEKISIHVSKYEIFSLHLKEYEIFSFRISKFEKISNRTRNFEIWSPDDNPVCSRQPLYGEEA
jgi:hypothetical protein